MMEDEKCMHCSKEAKYYCTCKIPNVYLCKSHREAHEASPGDHPIRLKVVEIFKPDPICKQNLIQEIIKARSSAEDQINKVISASAKLTSLLQNQIKEALAKLDRFISLCNDVLSQIYSIESIRPKEIYSQIEALLLFEDSENIIRKIKAPTIEIAEVPNLFSYHSTTFPHFLYNFSETNISFPVKEGVIQVSNPEKTIKNTKLNIYQRCLSLRNKKVLITGGSLGNNESPDALILDILSGLITEIPRLIYPRTSHSMAWINGAPSVIGGFNQGKSMKNVEVFMNNKWVEIQSLNIPRVSMASITFLDTVWTIGGINGAYLNSIERYKENQWILLSITLPFPCAAVGLICIEGRFLIIGGASTDNKISKDAFIASKDWTSIEKIGCLSTPMYFSFNQFHVKANKISIMGKNADCQTLTEIIKVNSLRL